MRSRPMGRNRTAVVGMVTSSHFNMLGLKSKGSLIGNEFGDRVGGVRVLTPSSHTTHRTDP